MNKDFKKGLAIASIAIAGLGAATTTHADELNVSVEGEKTEFNKGVSDQSVTYEQVLDAESEFKTVSEEVASTQEKTKQVKENVDRATDAVQEAEEGFKQAQIVKGKATQEGIADQKKVVSAAEKKLLEAKKDEKDKQENLSGARVDEKTQEEVVSAKQDKVTGVEFEVEQAQLKVKQAKEILDGTNQASLLSEKEEADEALKNAEVDLKSKRAILEQAKQDDKKLGQDIAAAQGELSEASTAVLNSQNAVSEAEKKADQAKSDFEQAQLKFAVAENDFKAINTFQVTDNYVEALKSYVKNPYSVLEQEDLWKKHNEEQMAKLRRFNAENVKLNQYKSNENDKKKLVDPNNLTKEQQEELSLFASDLLNQVRKRFGTSQTVVSQGMLEVAKKVSGGYIADNWEFGAGHHNKVINSVAKAYGLPFVDNNQGQSLENLNSVGTDDLIQNMDDAKKWIHESLVDLLFNGHEWVHAESIAGLSGISSGAKDYFALSLSKRKDVTSSHWLSVGEKWVTGTKFDKTVLNNLKTAEAITNAYNLASTVLGIAKENNIKAQSDHIKSQEEYNKALSEKEQAEETLLILQGKSLKTPQAQEDFDSAERVQLKAKKRVADVQKALDDLTADVKVKKENLEKAQAILEEKQSLLESEKMALTQEQKKLESLQDFVVQSQQALVDSQKAVEKTSEELEKAKSELKVLVNADKVLQVAKNNLIEKQESLSKQKEELTQVEFVLNQLLSEQKIAQATYRKLVVHYETQLELARLSQLGGKTYTFDKEVGLPFEVNQKSEALSTEVVKSDEVLKSEVSSSGLEPVVYNTTTWQKGKVLPKTSALPNTDSESSGLSMLLVVGLAVAGLFGFKKKEL